MKAGILGMGWITPWGREIADGVQAVMAGRQAASICLAERPWPVLKAPSGIVDDICALPRLRRSSAISHFAVAAAKDAVTSSGLDSSSLGRCALVFASSDGGVIYTRRFYEDIIQRGPAAGSPLLFPETVYNAPASHIAATLGLSGEVLTLVGDCSTGLSAIHTACDLLQSPDIDYCLVVSAQELDWVSAEAYARWHLIRTPAQPRTAAFAEGAAALLLSKERSSSSLAFSHPGMTFSTHREADSALRTILSSLPPHIVPSLIISSASGSSKDYIELAPCRSLFPGVPTLLPKSSLGEALAVSALQQVIVASSLPMDTPSASILITARGFNGEINALVLTRNIP